MKTFKDLEIEDRYRSNKNNIYEEFYEKCLKKSVKYDRAVGYFTSGSLKLISKGLDKFIGNKGKIRIITSPNLTEEDLNALKAGEELKLIEDKLLDQWNNFIKEVEEDTLKVFSWMVAKGKLELKIAYQDDFQGLYHEKFGIFNDNKGSQIAFSGSVNETIGGMKTNFESIDTFNSLDGGKDLRRIGKFVNDFDDLWENNTNKLNIVTLPEAIKKNIIKFTPDDYELKNIIEGIKEKDKKQLEIKEKEERGLKVPNWLDVRPYQQEALDAWSGNKGRGILEMATGTGKTITALTIMTNLYKKAVNKGLKICYVILCPQKFLVEQWSKEVEIFNGKPIICDSDNNKWQKNLKQEIEYFNYDVTDCFIVITTTITFAGKKFQELLKKFNKKNLVLIVDECHNIGSETYKELLKEQIMLDILYRMGLSATPERHNDENGNQAINDYLGEIVYKFNMETAIEQEFLTPYKYHVHFVRMNENEEKEYLELTAKINKMMPFKDVSKSKKNENSSLELLLFKRSRILHNLEDKQVKLIELLKKQEKIENTLIYCGAGKANGEEERSIDITLQKIKKNFDIKVKKFTSKENQNQRKRIINEFNHGFLNAIVAIKCLDEGVNIPSIEYAYILASSTNPREYIQRRGRVLRLYEGKERAYIHDFMVVPRRYIDEVGVYGISDYERNLLKKELLRVREFSRLSENLIETMNKIEIIEEQYKL